MKHEDLFVLSSFIVKFMSLKEQGKKNIRVCSVMWSFCKKDIPGISPTPMYELRLFRLDVLHNF